MTLVSSAALVFYNRFALMRFYEPANPTERHRSRLQQLCTLLGSRFVEPKTTLAEQAALLDLTQDSIFVRDSEDRITYWNQGATNTYGWRSEEAIGRVTHELLQTQFPVSLEEIKLKLLLNDHWEGELVHSRSDNSRIVVATRWALQRDLLGRPRGVLEINNDITARKEAERVAELHREEQLRFKDHFLSHVSHEIRTPLTAIYSFTSILADGIAGDLSPEQREYLDIVLKNITQLQAMVDDLLEVSRSKANKLRIELERVSLSEIVFDAWNTFRGTAEAKNINFTASCPPELPWACADATRLLQIMVILCDNAMKFTEAGGVVTIEGSVFSEDSSCLLVQVSDTGCGIDEDSIERVFEHHYQASAPANTARRGLGLGLHIAQDLVHRQGGEIWVTSTPQRGTTIFFTTPVFTDAGFCTEQRLAV